MALDVTILGHKQPRYGRLFVLPIAGIVCHIGREPGRLQKSAKVAFDCWLVRVRSDIYFPNRFMVIIFDDFSCPDFKLHSFIFKK